MLFNEPVFFLFFIAVFIIYWALPGNTPRKLWLLAASCVFYGAWDVRFLALIFLSITIDYAAGLLIERAENPAPRRRWLAVSLCANLGILAFFKYFNFFLDSALAGLQLMGLHPSARALSIVLPVGISFYTFQSMSYTIDVYRGHLKAQRNPFDLALFVMFFPQLVAGPIVRAATFLPQLASKRSFASIDFRYCLALFLAGFFKKACIADNLAPFVDHVFDNPGAFTPAAAWFGVVGYAIQIYCDFSGYTDMAIASAGFLGYELCDNFRHPYFAGNITDFWRRWHISLSTWLRDYLYIPLGGNRGSKWFSARNVMITMLLGGLWHGAGWNFILWGGLHGSALILHRQFQPPSPSQGWLKLAVRPAGTLLTFFWVTNAWVIFRAASLNHALLVFNALYFSPANGIHGLPPGWAQILSLLILWHWIAWSGLFRQWFRGIPDWAFAILYAIAVLAILPLVSVQYKPFIYFQF